MPPILKHHALDSEEVLKIANGNGQIASFLTYDQIKKLPNPGCAYVVLLRSESDFGHYVGLLNHGDTIEWYDSYAYKPDRELKWQTDEKNAELGQDVPKVSHLMRDFLNSGGKLEFNEMKFQDEKNTRDESCGYQVGVRILNHRLSLNDYQKWLKSTAKSHKTTPTNVVIKIGADILGQSTTNGGYIGSGKGDFEGGLFELSKSMPKVLKEYLNKNGDKIIHRMMVFRVPLATAIDKILSFFTLGKTKRVYDTLFHLYLGIVLDDGSKIVIEKNQRVTLKTGNSAEKAVIQKGSEGRPVKVPENLSLNQFINNAIAVVPNDELWVYSALNFNCQNFVLRLLSANDMMTPELKEFIWQDPEKIASSKGFLSSLADSVTNLANRFDNFIHGGERPEGGVLVVHGGVLYHVEELVR